MEEEMDQEERMPEETEATSSTHNVITRGNPSAVEVIVEPV